MDYQKLYTYLFNQITDAIRELDLGDTDAARSRLIKSQCDAEDMYISAKDRRLHTAEK